MKTTDSLQFTRSPRPGEVFEDETVPVEVMDSSPVLNALFNCIVTSHKETTATVKSWDRDHGQMLMDCESGTIHCLNLKWGNMQNRNFQEAVLGGKETFIPYYFTLAMQNIMVISLSDTVIKIKYPWWLIVNPKPEWWMSWEAMLVGTESEQSVTLDIIIMHGFTFSPEEELIMQTKPPHVGW